MAKYVKFLRGTPKAYENLQQKDSDTLYFIYEEDESNGLLYLGSKLIAGGGSAADGSSVSSLNDLRDVLLSNLVEDSLLVYDSDQKAWVNKDLSDLVFVGATEHSSGKIGLVPTPEAGNTELFLRSDGTWASPGTAANTILTIENNLGEDHDDVIATAIDGSSSVSGDIIIIKDVIAEGKWQYTAYVYDGDEWCAMDGNYSADNVYFNKDFVFTKAVGVIEIGSSGSTTVEATGKNVTQFLASIFAKETNPTSTKPSITLTFSNAKAYEVGSKVTPSYTATFNSGSYTYGPATGITVSSWEISDTDGNTASDAKGIMPELVVGDSTKYSITAKANYTEGAIPLTNMGNEYTAGQIAAGSASQTKGSITGYRNSFYGTLEDQDSAITSDVIRAMTMSNKALANGSTFSINVPANTQRVIIAYPATLQDLSSVKDVNGMNAEIISSFDVSTLDIEGANGYDAISYKVFIAVSTPTNNANTYDVTI